ncbi:response regulator [Falsiroseomonas sp. CW058]|uniref:response regulator n=1 Tax=Falsiroseomonas sp. CW058 TaxID=3388664 RepID=UPI003D31F74D
MPLILIVDDRATNRSIYARLAALIGDGVVVETFEDPVDALEWLATAPVDLVITDYRMPSMDGAEFTRRLRAGAAGDAVADVPVIVVTAYDDRSFRLRAMEAGATDFLQSPVDHVEFVARARNLLALPRRAATARPPQDVPAPQAAAAVPALDDLPALITAADRAGCCLFVNTRQARRVGAAPEELVGQDIARVVGQARAAASRASDQEVFATGRELPAFVEEAPGEAPLLTVKAPLRDRAGRVVGVVSTSFELAPGLTPFATGQAA